MPLVYLPQGSALRLNGIDLTEHNRRPVSISYEEIDISKRMANGFTRKFYIGRKRTINVSWDRIPSYNYQTIDAKAGALNMRAAYIAGNGDVFNLKIFPNSGSSSDDITCFITSATFEMVNRNVKNSIARAKSVKLTSAAGVSGNIIYGYTGDSISTGDKVNVSGFDSEQFNVYQAPVIGTGTGTFTVASQKSIQSSVTAAISSNGKITYYSNNTFSPGDVVTISGLKTATITGATAASGKITFASASHPYTVGDVINISGITPSNFNLSNVTVVEKDANTFKVSSSETGTYASGGTASSVFNLTNVVVDSADTYYFKVSSTFTSIDLEDSTTGIASVFPENTSFTVTKIVANSAPTKTLTLTSANHDLVSGDVVSLSGVRTSATITNAGPRIVDIINRSFVDSTGIATITTNENHGYSTGDSITISDGIDETSQKFHGTYTITKTSDTVFTFTNNNIDSADIAALVGNSTVQAKAKKSGETKYLATNTFAAGDRVTITGIDPNGYNGENLEIVSASPTQFIISNNTTSRFRKGGTAVNTFNVSGVTVSSVTKDTITIPHPYGVGGPSPVIVTAASASGTAITYTSNHNFVVGQTVTISGLSTTGFNLQNAIIASITSSTFVVNSTVTGTTVTNASATATSVETAGLNAQITKRVSYFGDAQVLQESTVGEFWNVSLTFEEQ